MSKYFKTTDELAKYTVDQGMSDREVLTYFWVATIIVGGFYIGLAYTALEMFK